MHKTRGRCRPPASGGERPIEGPLPKSVQIVRANLVYVEKKDLPPAMLNRLLRLAAFQNPEFYKAQAMRLSTYDKPRVIACGQDFPQHIALPRGCLAETLALLEATGSGLTSVTNGIPGTPIEAEFQGSFGLSRRKLSRRSPATTKVSSALRRRSGRQPLPHG